MTTITAREPSGKSLLWAGGAAFLYSSAMAIAGLACANFLARLDNLGALAITFVCAAILVLTRKRRDAMQYAALFAAGILIGLYLQPSTAFLVAAFVAVMAIRHAVGGQSRPVAFGVLLLGTVTGLALLLGLMRLITGSDLRC